MQVQSPERMYDLNLFARELTKKHEIRIFGARVGVNRTYPTTQTCMMCMMCVMEDNGGITRVT